MKAFTVEARDIYASTVEMLLALIDAPKEQRLPAQVKILRPTLVVGQTT